MSELKRRLRGKGNCGEVDGDARSLAATTRLLKVNGRQARRPAGRSHGHFVSIAMMGAAATCRPRRGEVGGRGC